MYHADMAELTEKLAEQWRLVRQAPIPYAAALIILAGLIFAAFQWGYGRILDQKDAAIGTLKGQVDALNGERDDLRKRLAEKPSQGPTSPPRDPDAFYQFGELVAHSPSGNIDRTNGMVSFPSVVGGPNFNVHSTMDYRQFILSDCRFDIAGSQGSMGITTAVGYGNLTCRISGVHP
jgi:hypothetical protein